MLRSFAAARPLIALALALSAGACGGSSGGGGGGGPPLAAAGTVYATTSTNDLVTFVADAPETFVSSTTITGLQLGETIAGLDLRAGTGDLLALGSTGRFYRIDPSTAVATELGAAVLTGTSFGFDVDPDTDQIRVVSDADENVRANAANGVFLGADAPLTYAGTDVNSGQNPNVVGLAYTSDAAGASTATAYAIDATLDTLVRLGGVGGIPAPATGALFTVGALGVATTSAVAFDIAGGSGNAYAALTTVTSDFYRINLSTGEATFVGPIGPVPTSITGITVVSEQAVRLLALTAAGTLVEFRADAPGVALSSVAVSGLITLGETLVGIDVRPATGQLFGVSTMSRLYRIDRTTGVATPVGSAGAFTLSGTDFGLDFNPTVDRIRVVSDSDQNLRINPNDGTLTANDATLQYAGADVNFGVNPNVVASSYTNSVPGATTTQLFGIDSNVDALVLQNPPDSGTLNTIGSLGFNTSGLVGFDVVGSTGQAFASLTSPAASSSGLFRVSLGTGTTSFVGTIAGGAPIVGLTVVSAGTEPDGAATIFVVDTSNNLYRVSSENPSVPLAPAVAITGLQLGETVLGIDVRPATGVLFLLGSSSRLYTVSPATGVATAVGSPGVFTLTGSTSGFDFNPTSDLIRVTGDAEQNLRLDPSGALVGTDTALAYAVGDPNFGTNPNVAASAYTGGTGATTTTLYDVDSNLNVLAIQNPPNAGTLLTVGGLGVTLSPGFPVSLDVAPPGGRSYAAGTVFLEGTSRLFVVNLATGVLSSVGTLPGTSPVRGIAVQR